MSKGKGKKWDKTSFMECWKKHGKKKSFEEFAAAMIGEAKKLGVDEPSELAVWNRVSTIRKALAKGASGPGGNYKSIEEALTALDKHLPCPTRPRAEPKATGKTVKDVAKDIIPGF
jgi:hypothetical protein